ncbi:adenosylcobinamide-GDP ribazoletransferase [Terrabacter sp. NPDC080008]|uniref:adenosylcobinamide-GDP ribazoletransferase n=1 Tax=Terrabacter sp. NPDC080008 TaxID=3155176 RepID=UPI00344F932A
MRDAWRFAVGTFTALPVRAPEHVDRRVTGLAMLLAPATTVGAGLAWVVLALVVGTGLLPAAVAATLALTVTTLQSRALHLDGLADLADGLTSGHDRERSLAVMRRGDTGPAGAAALVLVLLLDAACLTTLLRDPVGTALAVVALAASRLACAVCARDGIPPARPEGLGQGVAGTVGRAQLVAASVGVATLAALAGLLAAHLARHGSSTWWLGAALSAAVVVAAVGGALATRRHAVRRLGGITGDVIGAAIEVSLAVGLVAATIALSLA